MQLFVADCESLGFDSDAYWRCYIRQMTFTIYHPVGTCRMGAKSDPKAVVDPQLRSASQECILGSA